jgi:hypothetical protein
MDMFVEKNAPGVHFLSCLNLKQLNVVIHSTIFQLLFTLYSIYMHFIACAIGVYPYQLAHSFGLK